MSTQSPESPHRSPPRRTASAGGGTSDRLVQLYVGRSVHPVYREQLHAVPDGFRYLFEHPALRDETVPTKLVLEGRTRLGAARRLGERLAVRALSRAGYVRLSRVRAEPGAAVIHSCERLLRDSPLPYVLDFEHAELFVLYQRIALSRPWTRMWLLRALTDERLRFLLPWSEAAERSLYRSLGPNAEALLRSRTHVVYPAIRPAVERPPRRASGSLRLLFVGTTFYEKGGVDAILAVRRLAGTHDVHLDLLSYVPEEWRARLQDDPAITVHAPAGADAVRRLYAQADALLFPTHVDTFGYVMLEAMAWGLPVVAPRHLAAAEIVAEDRSGLLFTPENTLFRDDGTCRFAHTLPMPRSYLRSLAEPTERYLAGLTTALARLAEDRDLHARLAEGALEQVRSGRFSVERRREALRRLYAAAAE